MSKPSCSVVLILLVAASSMAAPAAAQTGFEPPRLAGGRPDLQGVWDFRTLTPLERPEARAGQPQLTPEEAAAIEAAAVQQDTSRGHSLVDDPSVRAVQERFVLYAARDLSELRLVLRSSSDAAHRALAAQVLGYAADKQAVVEDLVHAMNDASAAVRNSAMRALGVFAHMLPGTSRSVPRVPAQPFIELLNSPVWSDRNKASGALMAMSADRDPELLAALRERALAPLIEMAWWKSEGHALPAFLILCRIAGYSDAVAFDLWERGDRDAVIDAARNSR